VDNLEQSHSPIKYIYAKDIRDWEHFNKRQLELLQKEVDAGHQPWRISSEEYARVFLEVFYGLVSERTALIPQGKVLREEERSAFVKFEFFNRKHIVELEAPIRNHLLRGIWVAKSIKIE
jgi:hypothetical protein